LAEINYSKCRPKVMSIMHNKQRAIGASNNTVYHIKDTSNASQYLQGSVVTQTVLGGLYRLHIFCSVHVPKNLSKLAGSKQSYCKNKKAHFIWPTL